MKLSPESIRFILKTVAKFDRERGIPHNYFDLEKELCDMEFHQEGDKLALGPESQSDQVLTSRGDI